MGSLEPWTLEMVPDLHLSAVWPKVVQSLEETRETWEESQTIESLEFQVFEGQIKVWALLDKDRKVRMALMTQFMVYPQGTAMQLIWASGKEAAHAVQSIQWMEDFAQSIGCFRLEIVGRAGWLKLLSDRGYKELCRVVAKPLGPTGRRDH